MDRNSTFHNYLGRFPLGRDIALTVQCTSIAGVPTAPDAAPTCVVYAAGGGAPAINKTIPPLERYTATGLFQYMQFLNSSFSVGLYYATFRYLAGGVAKAAQATFEVVAGGDTGGMVNSMFFLDRPGNQDWILAVTDSGSVTLNRGPK